MRTILVPVFNDRVSSRLDCADCFQLVKINKNEIQSIEKLKLISKNHFTKVKSILALNPDAVICNGLTSFYENEFKKNNIDVLPWIHGEFEEVVEKFISGSYKKTSII